MSKIKTVPIAALDQIKSEELIHPKGKQKKENFLIPDYQRGYRWEAQNEVDALLEDIWDFCQQQEKKPTSAKYSLQPLVVSPSSNPDFSDSWEVIDGQQRLTTLWLIQKALGKDTFGLQYEKRPDSGQFLKDLVESGITDDSNPDFHFMGKAWEYINAWLETKRNVIDGFDEIFLPGLRTRTEVIWYDVESADKNANIDVFHRLNVGKIPLTDTELTKALLLQKIKGKYQGRELALIQSEINEKINQMEAELGKSCKWNFLSAGVPTDSPLDLILKLAAPKSGKDATSLYRSFEKEISNSGDAQKQAETAMRLWHEITAAYAIVNSLFCETREDDSQDVYHYAGYLLATKTKTLEDIYGKARTESKRYFSKWLKTEIANALKKQFRKEVDDNTEILEFGDISYTEDKELAQKILLLFNVLECNWAASPMRQRFPFNRYNTENWSLEHIRPQEDVTLKTVAELRSWLKAVIETLDPIDVVISMDDGEEPQAQNLADYKEKLGNLLTSLQSRKDGDKLVRQEYASTIREIIDLFSSEANHYLANLALLPKNINSALNNAPFPQKRNRIIENEELGAFIPPATRNVFLKTYSPSASQPYFWGLKDQEAYLERIKASLNRLMEEAEEK